jgi:hypothetical protein
MAFENIGVQPSLMQCARRPHIVPDTVALIIWIIAGVAGGNATGELLGGDYDLGPGNTVAGAVGGVIGTQVLQLLVPALRGFDLGPLIGQAIEAAVSGAVLTVIVAAVKSRRRRRRQ